jgi:ferredoxin--NADP+ reductase
LDYSREIIAATRADPLVGEQATRQLRYVTSLTQDDHPLEGRITALIRNGALFHALDAPTFDPAHDRIMICGGAPMLQDLKQIAVAAGFVEGANHEPGTFVIERAFAG